MQHLAHVVVMAAYKRTSKSIQGAVKMNVMTVMRSATADTGELTLWASSYACSSPL